MLQQPDAHVRPRQYEVNYYQSTGGLRVEALENLICMGADGQGPPYHHGSPDLYVVNSCTQGSRS